MSELIESRLPCPSCPSSDAYHLYENGGYCFSCHYFKPAKNKVKVKLPTKSNPSELNLFFNASTQLSDKALAYLYDYQFTDELIKTYDIREDENFITWSSRTQKYFNSGHRLLLPYYENSILQFYEAKRLDITNPLKYVSSAKGFLFKTFTTEPSTLVVVEDILSAMRVGETISTVALRGTAINSKILNQLLELDCNYIIWLDHDRAGYKAALELGKKLLWNGTKVEYITTTQDPKWYTDLEIKGILKNERKCNPRIL